MSVEETISHFSRFIADLWQIHAFGEGNTRATAIFAIKYLNALGFKADNDLFAEKAFYFRNALARANYTNLPKGIHPDLVYLERFFTNLLAGGSFDLKSRELRVTD